MTASCWRIHKLESTASTNDDVRHAAEAGEAEGLVVVAERQSSGRGRQGRVWESPVGNLYCSVLLRPKNMPRVAGVYSFVAALAVCDTVKAFLPTSGIALKWPNDVLVNGKKISGILLEVAADALIVGVGLNVRHVPENTLYPATSLELESGHAVSLSELLDCFLARMEHWYTVMQEKGFAPVRHAWLAHAQKGDLTARLPLETVQGRFVDIDETGCLRLLLADGAERSISTGDVFFAPKD